MVEPISALALVLEVTTLIQTVYEKYKEVMDFKDEVKKFRNILLAVTHVLLHVKAQLEQCRPQNTSLRESINILYQAVQTGDKVLEKFTSMDAQKRFKRFFFTRLCLHKLAACNVELHCGLSMLSAAGVVDIRDGIKDVEEKMGTLRETADRHHDELLEKLQHQSTQLDALQELIREGFVNSLEDYTLQLQEIKCEIEAKIMQDTESAASKEKEEFQNVKATLYEQILQLVKQLSLHEKKFELPICPISLDIMEDPVLVHRSGVTYDKRWICESLLQDPYFDPYTRVRYDSPLSYTDDVSARQQLIELRDVMAYKKYDDTQFKMQYKQKWLELLDHHLQQTKAAVWPILIEYYAKIDQLCTSESPMKCDEALKLVMAQPANPVCLGFAAVLLSPACTYPCTQKDAAAANRMALKACDYGLKDQAKKGEAWQQYVFGLLQEIRKEINKSAVEWYCKAAEQGLAEAQNSLGYMYANGQGIEQNYAVAVKWYQKAAEQGHAAAQYNLGNMHDNGEGLEQNNVLAVEWYRKAAVKGHASAQNNLGNVYQQGYGVEQNYALAVEWYRKGAEQDNSWAQYNLGYMYGKGFGVEQNDALALEWYQKGAKQGHAAAQNNLGAMYDNGLGVEKDCALAVEWYHKAAEQGDAAAQYNLGVKYDKGQGVKQNHAFAVVWFRKAADQGIEAAQNCLGYIYQGGLGVEQNHTLAVEWFRQAAKQGHAAAQNNLAYMYQRGFGVEQNDLLAVVWYNKAAEKGHVGAQNSIGNFYRDGQGVVQSDSLAVEWYRKAAEQGHAVAQYNLGNMFDSGQGVEQDDALAVEWYRKAAEQGHAVAQYSLGYMYGNGHAVEQDDALAVEWYRKAAEQGDADAQHSFGCSYENGQGAEQSDSLAVKWLQKAAEQGHVFAKWDLQEMKAKQKYRRGLLHRLKIR